MKQRTMGIPTMGIGKIGSPTITFSSKRRYTVEVVVKGEQYIEPHFVRLHNRPTLHIEEDANGKPVSQKWEPVTVTHYEVEDEASKLLSTKWRNMPANAEVVIKMYGGTGNLLEAWTMEKPKVVKIGGTCYTKYNPFRHDMEPQIEYEAVRYDNKCATFNQPIA